MLAVQDWFLQKGMLFNAEKSEVVPVGTRAQAQKFVGGTGVPIAGSNITFVRFKSLGVTLDQ